MIVLISGWSLITFVSLLIVVVLTSGIYFQRESSLLGNMIFMPGAVASFWMLFEALTLLSSHRSEAIFWATGWFLGFLLYQPALLFYFASFDEDRPTKQRRITAVVDLFFVIAGITYFIFMVRTTTLKATENSLTITPAGFLPKPNYHFSWYILYFVLRITVQLRKMGKQLFANVSSAQWRRILWFPLTVACMALLLTDYLSMCGLPLLPIGQVASAAFFFLLFAGVRYRFFFRPSARFAADEILQTMPDPLLVCDTEGHIQVINNAFCEVFDYRPEEIIGKNLFFTENRENRRVVLEAVREEQINGLERILYDRNGNPVHTSLSLSWLHDRDKARAGAIVAVQDIRNYHHALDRLEDLYRKTEAMVQERTKELQETNLALKSEIASRRQAQERLHHAAYHDSLTGLPNREMFTERLQLVFSKYMHRNGAAFALLYIDLDRFKMINDSLGHLSGDMVLQETAVRLGNCLRDVDTIGRMGGDEFVVLMEDIGESRAVIAAAERIIESMKTPFCICIENRVHEISTSASVGITIANPRYINAEEMLRDADLALYRAKEIGKNCYEIFNEDIQAGALAHMDIERGLRKALQHDEFELHYQPIINLATKSLAGFEALIRWHHPEKGLLPPASFIPVAEESDLIVEIDRWVLQRSCSEFSQWHKSLSSFQNLPSVSINISARHLAAGRKLIEDIKETLKQSGLSPETLIIEITESAIIKSMDTAKTILNQIKGLGVGLHLDDFGEGYSSVNLLRNVPFDAMKIDRAYVTGMKRENPGSRLLRTIVELGHSMDKSVIAEGIEDPGEATLLESFHCEHGQGFLFSKPIKSEDIGSYMEQFLI